MLLAHKQNFGIGKMREVGQRLLELCLYHTPCIMNAFFSNQLEIIPKGFLASRFSHWHQLDVWSLQGCRH